MADLKSKKSELGRKNRSKERRPAGRDPSARLHSKKRVDPRRSEAQCLPLFLNELNMVGDVSDGGLQELFERLQASLGMIAHSGKGFIRQLREDSGHLLASGLDQVQLFVEISVMVKERFEEEILVGADQKRLFMRNDALHTIRHHGFEIADVADHLERAHFAGYRPSLDLVCGHPSRGLAQQVNACNIFRDHLRVAHGDPPVANLGINLRHGTQLQYVATRQAATRRRLELMESAADVRRCQAAKARSRFRSWLI
jgi:hypothetical protein